MKTVDTNEMDQASNDPLPPAAPQDPLASKKLAGQPDGTFADDYSRFRLFSYQRWAWVFLRRNKKFRAACKAIKRLDGDTESEMARVAAQFGLKRYKPYTESFSSGRRPLFNTSRFLLRFNSLEDDQEPKVVRLQIMPGEVAVRFDLKAILNNSWGLRGQLKEAEKRVREIVEKQAQKIEIEKSPIERISPEKLIEYVRMLDHRLHGATQIACNLLVNEEMNKKLKDGAIIKDDLYSNASDKQARADFFAEVGYLYLAARSGRPDGR